MYSYSVVYPSLPPMEQVGLCFRGVSFSPVDVVGPVAPLNIPSGASKAEPTVIVPPSTLRPMAQMVTPPVAVGVEAEAPVFRQSLEATAVSVAHRSAEASSPDSLVHTSKPYGGIFSIERPSSYKHSEHHELSFFCLPELVQKSLPRQSVNK